MADEIGGDNRPPRPSSGERVPRLIGWNRGGPRPKRDLQPPAAVEAGQPREHTPRVIPMPDTNDEIAPQLRDVLKELGYKRSAVLVRIIGPDRIAKAFFTGTDRDEQSTIVHDASKEAMRRNGLDPRTDAGQVAYVRQVSLPSAEFARSDVQSILVYSLDGLKVIDREPGRDGRERLAMFNSRDPKEMRGSLLAIVSPISEEEIRQQGAGVWFKS